jgi:hypothetical protein
MDNEILIKKFDIQSDKLDYQFVYNNEETNELNRLLNNNTSVTIDHLRRVSLWKLDRVLDVQEELIERLRDMVSRKNLSIDDTDFEILINDLICCSGIGMPMASSILKFLRPDIFPIIDVRAYRALYGKKISYSTYNVSIYKQYVKRVYEIRDILNIPLSDVDQQLYCFDKVNNGKI